MAVRISSSKFLESTVAKNATLKGLDDPLPTSKTPLPNNIRDGVAKLTDIYFENDEKWGECLRAKAKIVFPKIHDGRFLEGKETDQWITFNAENLEDRIPRIRDILKGLGGREIFGDGKNIDYIKIVEFLATVAKRGNLYFGFSTNPKENNDFPYQNWHAAIPGFKETTSVTPPVEVQKKTESNGSNGSIAEVRYTQGGVMTSHSATPPVPWTERNSLVESVVETPPSDVYTDSDDLSSVINRAVNDKDNIAMDKLDEWAKELGYTQEDIDEAPDYRIIGDWVISGKKKDENVTSDPILTATTREIKEDQVYSYSPPGKREGAPRLKVRECRVTGVDNIRNVVTLQNLANKAEVYEVSFDDENLK